MYFTQNYFILKSRPIRSDFSISDYFLSYTNLEVLTFTPGPIVDVSVMLFK